MATFMWYPARSIIVVLLLLAFVSFSFAQGDSIQNLYFVKKNRETAFGQKDYLPGKKAFYIYRNCMYHIVLKNKQIIPARVIDIRNDSIYYTMGIHPDTSKKQDTFAVHPSYLKSVKLIADRMMGWFVGCSLQKRRYVFEKSDSMKIFPHQVDTVYAKDSSYATMYELVPYMTAQGINLLYRQCGKTYYYEGIQDPECEDTTKKQHPPIVKKWAWFTPSKANIIKGVNIGIQTMHLEDEQLSIRGVNLNADMLSFFAAMMVVPRILSGNSLINLEDTVNTSNIRDKVNGLSLSAGGLVNLTGGMQINGFSINGGICSATNSNGLIITGTQNFTSEFRGLVITGFRNRSIKGRGVQVGLLNVCKHLKGFQIGLWNVNSKRKLPLINWSF